MLTLVYNITITNIITAYIYIYIVFSQKQKTWKWTPAGDICLSPSLDMLNALKQNLQPFESLNIYIAVQTYQMSIIATDPSQFDKLANHNHMLVCIPHV